MLSWIIGAPLNGDARGSKQSLTTSKVHTNFTGGPQRSLGGALWRMLTSLLFAASASRHTVPT